VVRTLSVALNLAEYGFLRLLEYGRSVMVKFIVNFPVLLDRDAAGSKTQAKVNNTLELIDFFILLQSKGKNHISQHSCILSPVERKCHT